MMMTQNRKTWGAWLYCCVRKLIMDRGIFFYVYNKILYYAFFLQQRTGKDETRTDGEDGSKKERGGSSGMWNNTLLLVCLKIFLNEPPHHKTNKWPVHPAKTQNQPGHPHSLIRVFADRMKKGWVLGYPSSAQQRLWSFWADAQADLSLCWAYMPFFWFCHGAAQIWIHLATEVHT